MKFLDQLFFALTFVLFLSGCKNKQDSTSGKEEIKVNTTDSVMPKITNSAQALTIDKGLLKKYLEAYQNDTISSEKIFFSKLLMIIKEFNGKRLDTTVLTIGNIGGDMDPDTLFSRVYYNSDTIYVDSKWMSNNDIIWNYKYANPYSSFDSELLNYGTRSVWAIFAVGILYGIPEINSRQEFDNRVDSSVQNLVYDFGVSDLKKAGIVIAKKEYEAYLQNFKGDLVGFGEPETREGLWIWYKPGRRLISYYQP